MKTKALVMGSLVLSMLALGAPQKCLAEDDFARAWKLFNERHVLEARAILAKRCAQTNATPSELCLYADTFLQDDCPEETLRMTDGLAKRAISLDPEWGNAWKILAQDQNFRDHYDEAIRLSNKALAVKKPDDRAYIQRALSYQATGKKQAAFDDLAIYTKTHDAQNLQLIQAGLLVELGKIPQAIELYRYAGRGRPTDTIIEHIADCYARQHNYAQAVVEISQLVKINPKDWEARYFRAQYYRKMKDNEKALQDYGEAINLEPTGKFYRERASLLKELGRYGAANADLKKAEECDKAPF